MLIGLTGTYCAGKNRIAALLEQRNLPVLDVDNLGHAALEAEKAAIFSRFGEDLKCPDGTVDRRRLGRSVFGKPAELAALEALVHPTANRLTDEWIAAHGGKDCVINAALLHRSPVFQKLDCIILVCAPFFTRLLRARKRDKLPWLALLDRLKSQRNFNIQYLAKNADIYRVENYGISSLDYRRSGKKLERRLDEILSSAGLKFNEGNTD